MKEYIKEMAVQVNPSSKEIYEGEWLYNCVAWSGEELETLAKLLVKHCISKLQLAGYNNAADELIKQYGVE